jgi:hypothetical protein
MLKLKKNYFIHSKFYLYIMYNNDVLIFFYANISKMIVGSEVADFNQLFFVQIAA